MESGNDKLGRLIGRGYQKIYLSAPHLSGDWSEVNSRKSHSAFLEIEPQSPEGHTQGGLGGGVSNFIFRWAEGGGGRDADKQSLAFFQKTRQKFRNPKQRTFKVGSECLLQIFKMQAVLDILRIDGRVKHHHIRHKILFPHFHSHFFRFPGVGRVANGDR